MADSFKISASLDIPKSISQINADITKLQSQVNQLKITTEIDITKSLNNIQAKLNSIKSPTINVNINPINSDVTNAISNGLKGVQAQANQTASSVNNIAKSLTNLDDKFKKPISAITDNGIINAEKTIAKIKQHFSELGKVTIKGFYNDNETVDNLNKVAVKIKAITGETRTLNFELDKSGKKFYLSSGTSDNSGIDKMILSVQKAQDKLKSLRTDLASTLKSISTSFSDPNSTKAITDDTHIKNLRIQYIKALRTIADLKNADSTTMNSMRSNAEKEIDTLKRMIKEYQNAEYVATSLRTKDLSTNKTIQSQELDKFISKISKNKAVINSMTSDIESLKMSLNGIKDSNSFTKFLNELDVAKSKASSLNSMYQTIGGYDKQLDKLAQNWQKQGIYTEKLKATIDGLKASLSNIKTSDGLTAWINDFNSKIGSINQLPLKIAESRKQLNGIKQVWSEFQGKDKIISNINKELGKMGSRLGSIKSDKTFTKWNEDLSKLNTQILGLINNLNKQVIVQNNINNIQAKISTLNPNKDSNEIARLNEKLQLEQKSLTNLKNQSNIYSNLISFEQQEQYIIEKTSATRDKLLSSINAGVKGYKSSITSAINELNRLQKSSVFSNNSANPVVEQTKQQITQLIAKYQTLMAEMQGNITPAGLENIRNKLIGLSNQFILVTSTAKNFDSQLKSNNSVDKLAQKVALLTARIEAFKKVNSKSVKQFGSQYDSMLSELRNPNIDEATYNRINKQFQVMRQEIVAADKAGKNFFDLFKEKSKKFIGWFSLTYMFSLATRTIRSMISDVATLDKAMTNLKKVTDETESNYARFLKIASKQAQELHSTITDLVEQTATWAKLGYSLQDAQNLAKTSMIYSKVGEIENATAVSDLVTVMKAFNIESSKSITIVDALNELGNNFATSAGELGEGLTKSASALQVANNSFEQSIALLTGGSEITQNANEMGSALKVISMRIRGMKGDLEALGEEYENIESISKIQTQILNLTKGKVNIFDNNGNFRATYDILKDISEIYNDLSDPDRANLTEILFGKLRGNQGVALIQAFQSGQIQKAYETALNSVGSAQKEFDSWSKSIEAHVETFKSAFESLSNAVFENDFLKSLVDSGTKFVNILENIINKIGIIPTILAGISITKAFKNVGEPLNTPVYAQPQFIYVHRM